jgi:hypothetical protein
MNNIAIMHSISANNIKRVIYELINHRQSYRLCAQIPQIMVMYTNLPIPGKQ